VALKEQHGFSVDKILPHFFKTIINLRERVDLHA